MASALQSNPATFQSGQSNASGLQTVLCFIQPTGGHSPEISGPKKSGRSLAQQAALKKAAPVLCNIPGAKDYNQLQALQAQGAAFYSENAAAASKYRNALGTLNARIAAQRQIASLRTTAIDEASAGIRRAEHNLNELRHSSFVGKVVGPVYEAAPIALRILILAALIPLAFKVVLYFLLAPMAAKRPPISLLPKSLGVIENPALGPSITGSIKISQVSLPIEIDKGQEILVHPEYLQSSTRGGRKDTKWLLNNTYPWSSILSGMVMLTRIQTETSDSISVSASKEPLMEVGQISVPEGSSVFLKPRFLIGVITPIESAVRITRHWRLNSLHAWLTLQIRFLVFHGPCQLIVKGGRGVRLEPALTGRSINQGLTMGFSANILYSTVRCETFWSYLTGKKNLLNDQFAGNTGLCICEEMPVHANGSGFTGRGLEGITDAVLNVVGI